jgi:hypothetical protein
MRVSPAGAGPIVPLRIDVLDAGAAQTLLTRGMDSHAIDAAGWREIVEWVDRLPLALVLLRGALYTGAVGLAGYSGAAIFEPGIQFCGCAPPAFLDLFSDRHAHTR